MCLIGRMTNALTNTAQHNTRDLQSSLVALQRSPQRHYSLSPASRSLAIDIPGKPYVDRTAMSARAVISTPTIDRVGDVLCPLGCHIEHYANNPVVLWAHGLEGIGQPIGTSRDPAGNLAVSISKENVQATSWFSQTSLEAAQIFELIDEGIVLATSVRETPIKSYVRRDPDAGDVVIVEEWDLEEWSWCAVGVNPDAVAKTLNRNRLGGQPIHQSIMKSLMAVAPTLKRNGIGLPKEKVVTELAGVNDDRVDADGDDELTDVDGDVADSMTQPYGSTVVSAVHTSLTAACQNIQDAMGPLENPDVREGLQAILVTLQEQMTALEGLHSSSYPDQPSLKSEDEDDSQDDQAMKAFLASGQVAALRVLGLGARLKGLIAARNLTQTQRRTLHGIAQQMTRLVSQAKSNATTRDEAKVAALQKSIDELTGLVGSLKK